LCKTGSLRNRWGAGGLPIPAAPSLVGHRAWVRGPGGVDTEKDKVQERLSQVIVAHWCFCDTHMQELKMWSRVINLPHRQASYHMSMLPECLLDPLKNLPLSTILFSITQKHCSLW
jgi:hypothetical protein